jgi:tetratricopeptide (TPR) repeat protein
LEKATVYSTFTPLHDSARSEQLLIQALEISREINDRMAQAKLSWNLMLTYLFSKRPDQALEHGVAALSLARESGDHEQLAFVLNDLCRLYTCRGEFEKAHVAIKEAQELWHTLDHQVMLADSHGSEAEAYFNAGEFEQALQCSQAALEITERIENLWGQSYDRMLMSFVHLETGRLGTGIQLAEQSIKLADEAGLIASSIGLRSELAWVYGYSGAFEKAYEVIEQAIKVAEAKQPAWQVFPQAAKIRIHLLQEDVEAAVRSAGNALLEPISIPYARYTIFLCLANIELAVSRADYALGLRLAEELLNEVLPLTRVDIPEILRWKGDALIGLARLAEAHQVLTEACSLAKGLQAKTQLWPILASLATVNSKLGKREEAKENLEQARTIIRQIAESLHEVRLSETFLNRPQVRALMR